MRSSLILSTIFFCFLFGSIFSSCEKEDLPDVSIEKSKRTVLMYLVGKSNLSDNLMEDFNEIKKGFASFADNKEVNLLIYISNTFEYNTPTLLRLKKKDSDSFIIEEEIKTYPGVNSTDSEMMIKIMLDAFLKHPAQSYGLIMGSHADGWLPHPEITMRSFGLDNGKSIDIVDLASVLDEVTAKIGEKLDYILFDACFMQSVEVAYELRHSVNYLLGSPTEVPGPGAPYDIMAPSLFDTSIEFNEKIIDCFYNYYEEKYDGTIPSFKEWTGGVALSAINVKYIEKFTHLTNQLLTQCNLEARDFIDLEEIPYYDLRKRGNYSGYKFYYDIYSFLESVVTEDKMDLFNEWKATHDKMIYYRHTPEVYSVHDNLNLFPMKGTHGVSFYVPREGYESMTNFYRNHQWYEVGGWQELGW